MKKLLIVVIVLSFVCSISWAEVPGPESSFAYDFDLSISARIPVVLELDKWTKVSFSTPALVRTNQKLTPEEYWGIFPMVIAIFAMGVALYFVQAGN